MDGPTSMLLLSLALLVIVGNQLSAANQCFCSHTLKDRDVDFTHQVDFYLPGNVVEVVTVKKKLHCGMICLSRDFCKSFNFERGTGRCELTSDLSTEVTPVPRPGFTLGHPSLCPETDALSCEGVACPTTSRFLVQTSSGFCVAPDCPGLVPPGGDYRLKAGESRLTEGTVVGVATKDPAYCSADKVSPQNESVACGYNGTWSLSLSSMCRKPGSCADVKLCNSTYPAGEYWLYPEVFGGNKKVKVYCHEETPGVMREYVSMPIAARVSAPGLAPYDRNCLNFSETGWWINLTYHKLRLENISFYIGYQQSTPNPFAIGDGPGYLFFISDCMKQMDDQGNYICTNRGNGVMLFNSTFTGLIHKPGPVLEFTGFNVSVMSSYRSPDNRVVSWNCSGSCGGCFMRRSYLDLDPSYVPPDSEATFCNCPI